MFSLLSELVWEQLVYRVKVHRCSLHSELLPGCGGSDEQDFGTEAFGPLKSSDAVG